MADFSALLEKQKEEQDKEQIAISEAAQTFALQIQKEQGLGQDFIKREGISNAAVSVVQNFQQDLDLIADADFTGFKDKVEKYKALLGELEGSRRFDNKEKEYISKIIAPVLSEIYPLANAFTAVKFGLRDFAKQFKPLKLASRTLGGIPIIGSMIQKKIERQEAGEEELRRAERQRGKDIAKEARKGIEESLEGTTPTTPAESIQDELDDDLSKYTASDMVLGQPVPETFGRAKGKVPGMLGSTAGEETQKELANVEQDRFEESKSIWETIADNTEETVKLLEDTKEQQESEGGLGDTVKGALGAGAGMTGLAGLKKFFGKKGAETAGTAVAKKTGAKVLGKTLLKSAIKKIPVIGAIAGIGFGLGRLMSGDVKGAALEVASGAAGTIPGVGTAASVGIDTALAARDMKNAESEINQQVQQLSKDNVEDVTPSNLKDIVNIDSKRTIVRTQLETDGLENMFQKLMPKEPQMQNNINTGGNTIQSANTTQVLPDLFNRNGDDTIKALKNVY